MWRLSGNWHSYHDGYEKVFDSSLHQKGIPVISMTKKKIIPRQPDPSSDSLKAVYLTRYEITKEPMHDQYYRQLPGHVKDAVERLHHEAQTEPRKAIPELKKMIKQYPKLPQLYNFLAVAYSGMGERRKAEAVTLANIRKNPDYLFARLNYAELCLNRKDYAKIPEIFDNKFDLQLLYPKRKRFHITEVVSFMGLMGIYFYEIHNREMAEKYNKFLQEIAPDYLMAKRLKRKLSPNLFVRLWKRLTGA